MGGTFSVPTPRSSGRGFLLPTPLRLTVSWFRSKPRTHLYRDLVSHLLREVLMPSPAAAAAAADLQRRITDAYTRLKRARFDNDDIRIELAERDLNGLLDRLPRSPQCSTN